MRRILTELSELVADEAVYVRRNIQILAELDFTFAKAKYAYHLGRHLRRRWCHSNRTKPRPGAE